tara:strand:- start:6421 stop:7485 length:1065 start_codon:yes stop_codon:yes gene_type:complete
MGQRYIGSKTQIKDIIVSEIEKHVKKNDIILDAMCGSGRISLELRKRDYKVIAVDVMSQASHITRVNLELSKAPTFTKARTLVEQNEISKKSGYELVIEHMNQLKPIKGYFWREFSPDGTPANGSESRKYFTSENAQKIDAARKFVKKLRKDNKISDIEYSLLIHDMIMGINNVANIAGTYGHYLSKFAPNALKTLKFSQAEFNKIGTTRGHKIINGYAEDVSKKVKAELCYIDPPYRKRQYAANYHILETIARGDEPVAAGKSGLREWRDQYSDLCSKIKMWPALEKIISEAKCEKFLLSYNSEGLATKKQIVTFLKKFGKVSVKEFSNKRFKSRNEKADENIMEYLFFLKRD